MSLSLEYKKAKRTGFIPAFLCGGILAAAVPIVNMAVRSEMYVGQQSSPMQILMGANWQMMAMLNILLVVAGSCLLYHTEFADNAMQNEVTSYQRKFHFLWEICFDLDYERGCTCH
ncbi:MAG: hypothetical protein ACLT1K_13220 [[Clostridium] leptum]